MYEISASLDMFRSFVRRRLMYPATGSLGGGEMREFAKSGFLGVFFRKSVFFKYFFYESAEISCDSVGTRKGTSKVRTYVYMDPAFE